MLFRGQNVNENNDTHINANESIYRMPRIVEKCAFYVRQKVKTEPSHSKKILACFPLA